MMFTRLVCAVKGHAYSEKDVVVLAYSKTTMETCDRCGDGERDLANVRRQSAKYYAGLGRKPA